MKKILIMLLFVFATQIAHAQTWDEFFKQKKTQKKYLLQQIAALQVYIGYANKGYNLAKNGLNFIGDMKDGEFNLHKDYFNSLKNVNPEIKKYYKVAEILALQKRILSICSNDRNELRKDGMMQPNELKYIEQVYARLLDDCSMTLDELIDVSTANKLEMKDDQRIKRIDGLHLHMQDNYTFARGFGNEAKLLSLARKQEVNEVKTSREIQGIKN